MRILCFVGALLCAAPALAAKPMVVVSTGRLVILGDRAGMREHLMHANRAINDALLKARDPLLAEYLENARNRLDNTREFLGFEREEVAAKSITKEGREDDDRLADAVVSDQLIVTDLDTLWWELGRADYNLSKATGIAKPEPLRAIEQARGDIALVRGALQKMVENVVPERDHAHDRDRDRDRDRAPEPPPAPPPPRAMADPAFLSLVASLEHESFDNDRLRVLEAGVRDQLFMVDQAMQILARFPFSDSKLRAVRMLKDRVVDSANITKLYAAFTFESDKDALKRILAGTEVPRPQAIDNRDLERLVSKMRQGYASRIGFQILTEQVPSRWFVIDQVAQVIAVFPTFDDRFRALEIVRPRVLDPENWQRLETLFSSMDDRARLRAMFLPRR